MTQTIDDLSIEELQNRLLEIQEKIKEKEKNSLIDQLAELLRQKETGFIQELLDLANGKKTLEPKLPKPEPIEKKPSKFVGKSEVYLRGGKVFYGIQEVKYTRLDRNGILRISKDGKGLPPKVESLPAHIQKIVLALPQKKEVPPAIKPATTLAPRPNRPQEPQVATAAPGPDAVALREPDSHPQPAASEPAQIESAPASEPEPVDRSELSTPIDESAPAPAEIEPEATATDEPIELVQIDLLEVSQEQLAPEPEPELEPVEPPRKRRSTSRAKASLDDSLPEEASTPAPAPAAKPKKPEFHVLQGSFF